MRAIREFSSPLIRSGHMPNDFLSEVRILFPSPSFRTDLDELREKSNGRCD